MKILWESQSWPGARIEPAITNLAWIAQPDKPDQGLLGVGTDSGSVGITMTDLRPCLDDSIRYNFNLRGHHSPIRMVIWNKSQCKLASLDTAGIIYVWVRNEDRWSVELVNDRGVKVNDLSWSPCGNSALICYEDNFVLIGSANGQRVWSNSFAAGPLTTVSSGVWAPDSRQLVLGFASGTIQVLSNQGANITERKYTSERIQAMAFSPIRKNGNKEEWTLAMFAGTCRVYMVDAYDQITPSYFRSKYSILQMQWNEEGTILALTTFKNELIMLDTQCRMIHRERVTINGANKPLTAFTWAHNGTAVVIAAGGHLSVGRILFGVPRLFDLVAYGIWTGMGKDARNAGQLPVPKKEISAVKAFDHHIIRCRIPKITDLCTFVCSVVDARCYCTIRPMAKGTHSYMLCMEHLGGLVPLLIGRQVNRFLPQFQISLYHTGVKEAGPATGSSAQVEDVNSMMARYSTGRNSLWRRSKRQIRALMSRHVRPQRTDSRLLQVTSNVWCTKFSIASMSPQHLPNFLGQVVYKTSVLHLQPRQMTIELAVLENEENVKNEEKNRKMFSFMSNSGNRVDCGGNSNSQGERGLTDEERQFFTKVLAECLSLRAAMDATTCYSNSISTESSCQPSTSSQEDTKRSRDVTPVSIRTTDSRTEVTSLTSTASTWHEEIEMLDFIDGDDVKPVVTSLDHQKGGWPYAGASKKDADAVRMHVDKLASIAEQLSKRHDDFNTKKDKASINKMRSQMKELLRRVNEIEKKVSAGDVKVEVQQLLETLKEMKKTLGEGASSSSKQAAAPARPTVVMHNKTPFWNEQNQVYQLDFGGRVTTESAKNFQIEMDGKQVLQFGKIEGGFTLDFRMPFSASQAFAVALASITQRLK